MEDMPEGNLQVQDRTESYISPLTILLFLALLILLGMLLGNGFVYILEKIFGYDLSETMDTLNEASGISKRNFIRFALLINHLILFILPPLVISIAFFKREWYKFLSWRKLSVESILINGLIGAFLILASMPFIQYVFQINKALPLPEWARSIEESTNTVIKNLLVTEASWELFFNIFVIAIIPAIGEEMVFRGIVQKRLEKLIKNPVWAIWIAATLFSAFHFQLEGFLPRLILGALLGYLFYWSKSLWIPIFVHFANNAFNIFAIHFFSDELVHMDIDSEKQVPIWVALISLSIVISICYFLKNYNTKKNLEGVRLNQTK